MAEKLSAAGPHKRAAEYKYLSLVHSLKCRIAHAGLEPGDRLPTENELVEQHGLSRSTVRRALSILEQDGFIYRRRKQGTFVRRAVDEAKDLGPARGTVIVAMKYDYRLDPAVDLGAYTSFRGLEQELADLGFSIRIIGFGADQRRDRDRLLRAIVEEDVQGICTLGLSLEPFRELITSVPVVSGRTPHPTKPPWVGLNYNQFTYECVQYLIERGHREIDLICDSAFDKKKAAITAAAYRRAMESQGLPFRRNRIYYAFEGEPLAELAESMLIDNDRATGVLAVNWRTCQAMVSAAGKLGLSIPDDLSVISIGQNVLGIESPVPVTTYLIDNEEIGRQIARTLVIMLSGEEPPREPLYPTGYIKEGKSVLTLNRVKGSIPGSSG